MPVLGRRLAVPARRRLTWTWKHRIRGGQPGVYGLSDRLPGQGSARQAPAARAQPAAGQHTRAGYRKDQQMFRAMKTEKVKQLKPGTNTAMRTILFFVLLAAGMLFIAFAGHI
jgi:hypothetical protein